MASDVLKRIGTPFFTTRPDGTGLGVVLARAVVMQHGGEFFLIRRLECHRRDRRQIETRQVAVEPLGPRKCIEDRETHVVGAHLRDRRTIDVLDH